MCRTVGYAGPVPSGQFQVSPVFVPDTVGSAARDGNIFRPTNLEARVRQAWAGLEPNLKFWLGRARPG